MTKMQMVSTLIKPTLHICHTHIVYKPPYQFRPSQTTSWKFYPQSLHLAPTSPKNTFVFLPKSHSSQKKHLYIFTQISLLAPKSSIFLPPFFTPTKTAHQKSLQIFEKHDKKFAISHANIYNIYINSWEANLGRFLGAKVPKAYTMQSL